MVAFWLSFSCWQSSRCSGSTGGEEDHTSPPPRLPDNTSLTRQYENLYLLKSLGSQPLVHYTLSEMVRKQTAGRETRGEKKKPRQSKREQTFKQLRPGCQAKI